ncbi:hypothetical protein ADUPG1_010020, partial [Aduncisulcus paluster]
MNIHKLRSTNFPPHITTREAEFGIQKHELIRCRLVAPNATSSTCFAEVIKDVEVKDLPESYSSFIDENMPGVYPRIFIPSKKARNRAFHNDIVAIKVLSSVISQKVCEKTFSAQDKEREFLPDDMWDFYEETGEKEEKVEDEPKIAPTSKPVPEIKKYPVFPVGAVVSILEDHKPISVIGHFALTDIRGKQYERMVLFTPNGPMYPKILIPNPLLTPDVSFLPMLCQKGKTRLWKSDDSAHGAPTKHAELSIFSLPSILLVCEYTDFPTHTAHPCGRIIGYIPQSGTTEAVDESILQENGFTDAEWGESIMEDEKNWIDFVWDEELRSRGIENADRNKEIQEKLQEKVEKQTAPQLTSFVHKTTEDRFHDLAYSCRYDFRSSGDKYRVFTIDPTTARDFDDAVHIRQLEPLTRTNKDGSRSSVAVYEIGVHIADVTYFMRPGSLIDKRASESTTTVYLVEKAIPMIPDFLSNNLCSLNPLVPRFTFSVVWKMTELGEVIGEVEYKRGIIESMARLDYESAQKIIDFYKKDPSKSKEKRMKFEDFKTSVTEVKEGPGICDQLVEDVQSMWKLAKKMRNAREQNGALAMGGGELRFSINRDDPDKVDGYNLKITKEANWLVEEFMLMANQLVARRIVSSFPSLAFIRPHPSPQKPQDLNEWLSTVCGAGTRVSSGKDLADRLKKASKKQDPSSRPKPPFEHEHSDSSYKRALEMGVLISYLSRAVYRAGVQGGGPRQWIHWGVASPMYTHFTSPIRRYADDIVHRMLQLSLDAEMWRRWEIDHAEEIEQRLSAKQKEVESDNPEDIDEDELFSLDEYPFLLSGYICGLYSKAKLIELKALRNSLRIMARSPLLPHKLCFPGFPGDSSSISPSGGETTEISSKPAKFYTRSPPVEHLPVPELLKAAYEMYRGLMEEKEMGSWEKDNGEEKSVGQAVEMGKGRGKRQTRGPRSRSDAPVSIFKIAGLSASDAIVSVEMEDDSAEKLVMHGEDRRGEKEESETSSSSSSPQVLTCLKSIEKGLRGIGVPMPSSLFELARHIN